jgi:hypothetical protein
MKKFLICLLVVAIALLGFTGCPSPTSDDEGTDFLGADIRDSVRELADGELEPLTLKLGTSETTFLKQYTDGDFFKIINEIESDDTLYGQDYTDEYPQSGRYVEDGVADAATTKREENYPIFKAYRGSGDTVWTKGNEDGRIKDDDEKVVTASSEFSIFFDKVYIKNSEIVQGGIGSLNANTIKVAFPSGGTYPATTFNGDSTAYNAARSSILYNYLNANVDRFAKIDGDYYESNDHSTTNTYTRVSTEGHGDYDYEVDLSGERRIERTYSIQVGDIDSSVAVTSFKLHYTYTEDDAAIVAFYKDPDEVIKYLVKENGEKLIKLPRQLESTSTSPVLIDTVNIVDAEAPFTLSLTVEGLYNDGTSAGKVIPGTNEYQITINNWGDWKTIMTATTGVNLTKKAVLTSLIAAGWVPAYSELKAWVTGATVTDGDGDDVVLGLTPKNLYWDSRY